MAKFLEPEQLGLYGLIAATIGYAMYAVGFEFYSFSTRELIARGPPHWRSIVRDQAAFYAFTYAICVPVLVFVFARSEFSALYALWFVGLLVLEHAGQELSRILVAISEPLLASTVLFVRTGAWCLVAVLVMTFIPAARNLDFVLTAWTIGALIACGLGFRRIHQFDRSEFSSRVDWSRVRKGFQIAIPFLIASLAVRGMFTFDRYWIEATAGLQALGAYVLFAGMATAVLAFLDAAVIDFMYPRLVAAARAADAVAFRANMKNLLVNVVFITGALIAACWILSGPLVVWLDKPTYAENLHLLKWLLVAVGFYALGTIPHVALYAHHRDRPLYVSQVAGFFVFLAVCYVFGPSHGAITVPLALCAAFCVVSCWKFAAYMYMRTEQKAAISH